MIDAAPRTRSTVVLQPLTLGELLDRAVTLIVRRLALWLGVFAAAALPLALCSGVENDAAGYVIVSNAHPQTLFDFLTKNRFAAVDVTPLACMQVGFVAVGYPLAVACAIFLVERACDGGALSVRAALARAVRRLLSVYAVVLLWSFAASLLATAASFAVVGMTSLASAGPHGNAFWDWSGIVAVSLASLAVVFGAVPILAMLCAVAVCYAVIETQNPLVALRLAVVRIVRKGEIVRAMIVGDVALVVASTATGIAVAFAEPLDNLLRVPVGSASLGLLGSIVASVVCCTFVAFYARDARMRRDGSDLVDALRATSQ